MDQRNILWGRHDVEMELDPPGYNNVHPEPCIFLGGMSSVHQPNIHPGNRSSSIDPHHLPDHYDGSSMHYGMAQYNVVQHPAPSMSLVPINYGPGSSQALSHGNFMVHGGSFHEYGRNHFVDGVGGPYKRKNIENLHESSSCHYSDASTSTASSSFAGPVEAAAAYVLPHFGDDDGPTLMDESSSRSVRVRGSSSSSGIITSVPPHNFNHPNQVSYSLGQSFNRAGPFWFDQPSSSNSADGGALAWNQAPALPYVHAGNVNGVPLEVGNLGIQEAAESNRNSSPFPHFAYISPQHYNHHYPSPPVHGIRRGNFPFPPQVPAAFHRIPAHGASNSGPYEPGSFRMTWSQNGGVLPETMPRRRSGPHLRVLPVDEVAIIDLEDGYGGGSFDHHRDMRLDIEDMSYEDLLALGELIGNVNTGLSEEDVTNQLKTRTWAALASINLEELPCEDQETASCIICQDVYEERDRIGVLECGHEYHAGCLKKWLVLKNTCPICKSEALPQRK